MPSQPRSLSNRGPNRLAAVAVRRLSFRVRADPQNYVPTSKAFHPPSTPPNEDPPLRFCSNHSDCRFAPGYFAAIPTNQFRAAPQHFFPIHKESRPIAVRGYAPNPPLPKPNSKRFQPEPAESAPQMVQHRCQVALKDRSPTPKADRSNRPPENALVRLRQRHTDLLALLQECPNRLSSHPRADRKNYFPKRKDRHSPEELMCELIPLRPSANRRPFRRVRVEHRPQNHFVPIAHRRSLPNSKESRLRGSQPCELPRQLRPAKIHFQSEPAQAKSPRHQRRACRVNYYPTPNVNRPTQSRRLYDHVRPKELVHRPARRKTQEQRRPQSRRAARFGMARSDSLSVKINVQGSPAFFR